MRAWELLSKSEYETVWNKFEAQFNFKPTTDSKEFPSIIEPVGSITYKFEYSLPEKMSKDMDDVGYKSLIAFRSLVSSDETIYALDWQHDCYWFRPHLSFEEWQIPVFPDGDYSIFLAKDFSFGIFAHPWEQTFCIWGKELLAEFQKNKPVLFETIIREH